VNAVGANADILYLADDYGIQTGPLISPALFRAIFKPRMARLIRFLRDRSSAAIAFHSCGSVYALIPDFIDVRRPGLEPCPGGRRGHGLRAGSGEFGKHLVFWGAIDTQQILQGYARRCASRSWPSCDGPEPRLHSRVGP
jgi:uroporphyrinogen decarboxylase